jgi:hypothetical protein
MSNRPDQTKRYRRATPEGMNHTLISLYNRLEQTRPGSDDSNSLLAEIEALEARIEAGNYGQDRPVEYGNYE